MDPEENLRRQKAVADRIVSIEESGGKADNGDVEELEELVTALEEWASKGGFMPWEASQ